jgi:hypothetical protein
MAQTDAAKGEDESVLDFKGLFIIVDGCLKVPFVVVCPSEVVERVLGGCVHQVARQALEHGNGVIPLPGKEIGGAKVVDTRSVIRLQFDGSFEMGDGNLVLLFGHIDFSEIVMEKIVLIINLLGLEEVLEGFREIALGHVCLTQTTRVCGLFDRFLVEGGAGDN